MRIFSTLRYTVILFAILCASCGTALPTVKPYKLDVQQGNVVTSKMLLQLRPGMTKSQVRFIMGTPLIQDSFHGNRWDYVYQMREKGKIIEQRRVIIDFDGEALKAVRGDVIAKGNEKNLEEGSKNSGTRVINPTQKPEENGVLDKLKFWKKSHAELAKEAQLAKEKAEAEDAARNAAEQAKDELARKTLIPLEEPSANETQSIMAVPLVVMPISPNAPEAAQAPPAAPEVELAPAVDLGPVENTKAQFKEEVTQSVTQPIIVTPAVTPKATPASKAEPTTAVTEPVIPSEASSGMKFDRTLNANEEAQAGKPAAKSPNRAGNNSAPKSKDLPAENQPSYFDRMLEKIGF